MKVLYDVSIFGVVQRHPQHATGIYRVVDDLACALISSGKCSLNFCATEPEWHYSAIEFVKNSHDFKDICFSHSAWRYQSFRQFPKANRRANVATGFSKIAWRIARKILNHSAHPQNPKPIQEKSLKWADVFHSTFYAIPNQVRDRNNIRIFITIYDLIPILLPQFYNGNSTLKTIINGLQEDDWIICISQKTKDDLCNYRKAIDPRRVFVTHLAASDRFYPCRDAAQMEAVRSKYKIPAGQYILSLSTFEPRKNLAHLIRSFSQLIRQEPLKDLRLVLAGGLGWKYESIFEELTGNDEAIRSRIVFTGRVADEDMAELYSGAVAFVFPSLFEGFGLPPLEAMQCGVPVITSNTSSLPEVVGDAGIMVDPQDGDALCQAMLKLASDGNLREAMSQKSLQQAKQFSWVRCADQTVNAYQTAVSGKI
jgi:glycosyltransferase involved in cell wall biosynthesis